MKILSLCDGLGGGYLALNNLGIIFSPTTGNSYQAVEIDKHARKVADANLDNILRAEHDVRKINRAWVKKHGPFDLVTFGSPCQSLSNLGKRKGLEGKSRIFLDCIRVLRLVQELNPKAKYLIENVKMQAKFKTEFDTYIGTKGILVNSNLITAQNRERYYWSNFKMEAAKRSTAPIADILIKEELLSKKLLAVNYSSSTRYVDKNGKVYSAPAPDRVAHTERRLYFAHKANTLVTGVGCSNNKSGTLVVELEDISNLPTFGILHRHDTKSILETVTEVLGTDKFKLRKLSIREAARLQSIPDKYNFAIISPNQAYKTIGNGWTISVISNLLKQGL